MKKSQFKKMLKKEKNPLFKDRAILYPIIFINIVIIFICLYNSLVGFDFNSLVVLNFSPLIIPAISLALEIPAIIVDILTDKKINKMYKKYKKGEDYKDYKRISKPFIIISLILALIAVIFLLDYTYSLIFGNKPFLSIESGKDENGVKKYSSLAYDYYECTDERAYMELKFTKFEDPNLVEINGEKILLKKTDIIKDKAFIALPENFSEALIESDEFQKLFISEKDSAEFMVLTVDDVKNDEIEDFLDVIIGAKNNEYGEDIEWGDTLVQTFENGKIVGIYEYSVPKQEVYEYSWIYEIDGKLITNSFITTANKKDSYHDIFKKVEDTLTFIEQ